MSSMKFDSVSLLIADAGGQIRSEIKGILHHEGFREMIDTADEGVIREAIASNSVDLLLADFDLPSGDVCRLVHDIRHNLIGNNPFVVTIILASDPEKEDIMKIIDSGADDLMLKPITAGTLTKRIKYLVSNRKQFVVTSDYIGPTRRTGGRDGTEVIPEIGVPNPVKAKALGGSYVNTPQQQIDMFAKMLNEQKMERNAIHIGYLVKQILPHYRDGKAQSDVSENIGSLQITSEDISRRLKGTRYDHVGELCASMLDIAKRLKQTWEEPKITDLKLLPELSMAIEKAFDAGSRDADLARSISETVQKRSN